MGVVYKITDEVRVFILDLKNKEPEISCRQLVNRVVGHFQKEVSKSSVHEVLKEAQIVSPRGRKFKDPSKRPVSSNKFQIPAEKKAQLFAQLPTLSVPKETEPLKQIEPILLTQSIPNGQEILQTIQAESVVEASAEVLQRGAFYDIFPRLWENVYSYEDYRLLQLNNIQEELEYRTLMVGGFKVYLEDGKTFYLDSRLQALYGDFEAVPIFAPIERALEDMVNAISNNIVPIIIKKVSDDLPLANMDDFIAMCNNAKNKGMVKIDLLGRQGQVLAEFNGLLRKRRNFILGVPAFNDDNSSLYVRTPSFLGPNQDERRLLCNLPDAMDDAAIIRMFIERHGLEGTSLLFNEPQQDNQHKTPEQYLNDHAQTFVSVHALNVLGLKDYQNKRIFFQM